MSALRPTGDAVAKEVVDGSAAGVLGLLPEVGEELVVGVLLRRREQAGVVVDVNEDHQFAEGECIARGACRNTAMLVRFFNDLRGFDNVEYLVRETTNAQGEYVSLRAH